MNDALIRLLLIVIAAVTVLSGLAQLFAPDFVLSIVAREPNALGAHLFATVGMFMAITGAMFLQSLFARSAESAIPLWIGVQKIAAAILVGWAVASGLFTPLATGVAAFDAVTGVIAFIFWRRLRR